MKVYISGRIKDYPDFREHFQRVSHVLRVRDGHEVVNPCEIDAGNNPSYEDYMKADLKVLLDCDAIYMLDGWEKSAGARCEHTVAIFCGLQLYYETHTTL